MVADALANLGLDDARETDRLKIILGVDYGTTFTGKVSSISLSPYRCSLTTPLNPQGSVM